MRDADAYGITSTYGTFIGHNAGHDRHRARALGPRGRARAGPRHRAVQAAREPLRPRPLDPAARRPRRVRAGPLPARAAAGAAPRRPGGGPVPRRVPRGGDRARAVGGPPGGRAADAVAGLAVLEPLRWTWHLLRVHRLAAWAAADVAEVARARRDPAMERRAIDAAAAMRASREPIVAMTLAAQTGPQAGLLGGRGRVRRRGGPAADAARPSRRPGAPSPSSGRRAIARTSRRTRGRARPRP